MRKDFNELDRNTFFWYGAGEFDGLAVLDFCGDNGFGHFMLAEREWVDPPRWFASTFGDGWRGLKTFVAMAHARDILVSLHGRDCLVEPCLAAIADPQDEDVVFYEGQYYIEPGSALSYRAARAWVEVADMVGADGLYLDGVDSLPGKRHGFYTPEYYEEVCKTQRAVIDMLHRPMILQGAVTSEGLSDWWCLSGQRDCFPSVARSGKFKRTRDEWNNELIRRAEEARDAEPDYSPQVGWIDFAHGREDLEGNAIEDQTPESMAKLCGFARKHNMPIVVQGTLDEIDAHPWRDELLAIVRGDA